MTTMIVRIDSNADIRDIAAIVRQLKGVAGRIVTVAELRTKHPRI